MSKPSWKDKISNPAQIGGIETAVIDNGIGRGTRIAWINTGTGFRYKVVIDRAMDIADAFYNQHSLTWLSHQGIATPQPFSSKGIDWLRTFGGGLFVTCGLTHIGGPEKDKYSERGLHGQLSNIPAEIESILQPDPMAGKMEMSITGKIKQTQVLGPNLELKRTISGTIGQPFLKIHDEVTNRGNTTAPHMMLYHFNFGWPLVDEGSNILWKGAWHSRDEITENSIFKDGNDFHKCSAPLEEHNAGGEEAAYITPTSNSAGAYSCGVHNASMGIAIALRLQKEQLPCLTNWQHWGKGEYLTGLEPGTNYPIGQAKAREQNKLIHLDPGESKEYDLEFEVLDTEKQIETFIKEIQRS